MAIAHIIFDEHSQYGRKLRNMLNLNEHGDDEIADLRDVIIQMVDGGSGGTGTASNFANVVKRFGVGDYAPTQGAPDAGQLAMAKALFDELDSAYAKTSGNGSVSNVRAARDQLFAKLR